MVFAIGDQSSPKRVASGEFSEVSRQHYSLMIHYHHYHHYYHYYSLLFTIIHYYSVLSKFGRSVPSSSSFLMTCLRLQQNNECDKLFSWPHWPWLADDRWEVRQKKVRMGRFIHRVKSSIGKVALRSEIKNFHSIYSLSKTPVQPSAWSMLWMRRLRCRLCWRLIQHKSSKQYHWLFAFDVDEISKCGRFNLCNVMICKMFSYIKALIMPINLANAFTGTNRAD